MLWIIRLCCTLWRFIVHIKELLVKLAYFFSYSWYMWTSLFLLCRKAFHIDRIESSLIWINWDLGKSLVHGVSTSIQKHLPTQNPGALCKVYIFILFELQQELFTLPCTNTCPHPSSFQFSLSQYWSTAPPKMSLFTSKLQELFTLLKGPNNGSTFDHKTTNNPK